MVYLPTYIQQIDALTFQQLGAFIQNQSAFTNIFFGLNMLMNLGMFSIYKNSSSELREAKLKSDNALTLQERFFFKFSHELKNPLNGVLGNLEMAYVENLDPRVKILLSNAKVCGELLLQLINNILDSGKMEVGDLEINYTPTKMTDILEKIWGISSEMIKNKGLNGQLTIFKKIPPILKLDSYRILQIMLNLVRNAVRFTDTGRITISCNWIEGGEINDQIFEPIPFDDEDEGLFEKEEVVGTLFRSSAREDDNNTPVFILDTKQKKIPDIVEPPNQRESRKGVLKIIVSDTGSGMDESSVKKVFTLFPELFMKNVEDGLPVKGLSMWITRQVCAKMNGEIRLYSKPNRGSTFIVCINTETPRLDVNPGASQPEEEEIYFIRERRPHDTKMRALVMDDNPYNTDVIKKYLEKSQVDVVGCTKNGVEALSLYEKELAEGRVMHIITMDLDMPLLDGKAACEKIREYEISHNLPPCSILIVSGNCFESEIKECLDPNGKIKANHFVRKPMYFSEFQRLITNIQNHYAQNFRGPFHPKKVLIVDDNSFNLQFLGTLLTNFKYEYVEARHGKQAIEMYKKNWKDIAVIFMDCEMPIMDGYTATREIRKLQETKKLHKIKIFGVTGNIGHEYEMKCKEAGMNQIVCKPFTPENIKKIVTECLREYE